MDASGKKKWERPWSIVELREGSKEGWNLAADAGVSGDREGGGVGGEGWSRRVVPADVETVG